MIDAVLFEVILEKIGTSEGVTRSWDTRGRGVKEEVPESTTGTLINVKTPDGKISIVHFTEEYEEDFDPQAKIPGGVLEEGMFAYPAPATKEEFNEMNAAWGNRNAVFMTVPANSVRFVQAFEAGENGPFRQIELFVPVDKLSSVEKIDLITGMKRGKNEASIWESDFIMKDAESWRIWDEEHRGEKTGDALHNELKKLTGATDVNLKGIKHEYVKTIVDTLRDENQYMPVKLTAIKSSPGVKNAYMSMHPNGTLGISATHIKSQEGRKADSYDAYIDEFDTAIASLNTQKAEYPESDPKNASIRFRIYKLVRQYERERDVVKQSKDSGEKFVHKGVIYMFPDNNTRIKSGLLHEIGHYRWNHLDKDTQAEINRVYKATPKEDFPTKNSQKDREEFWCENYALFRMGMKSNPIVGQVMGKELIKKSGTSEGVALSWLSRDHGKGGKEEPVPARTPTTVLAGIMHDKYASNKTAKALVNYVQKLSSLSTLKHDLYFFVDEIKNTKTDFDEHRVGGLTTLSLDMETGKFRHSITVNEKTCNTNYFKTVKTGIKKFLEENNEPFTAAALLSNLGEDKDAYVKAICDHEIGHSKLIDYTMGLTDERPEITNFPNRLGEPQYITDLGACDKFAAKMADGPPEWQTIIEESAKDGWNAPTYYSKSQRREMFAECYSIYAAGRKELLHPKIVEFIERVDRND